MPTKFSPRDATRFISKFSVTLPGRDLYGELYSSPNRRTGRRAVILTTAGTVVWDSGNCYDVANCTNAIEVWLLEQLEPCCHCNQKTGGFTKNAQDQASGHPICDRCIAKTQEEKRAEWLPQATEVSITKEDLEASRAQLAAAVVGEDCPF